MTAQLLGLSKCASFLCQSVRPRCSLLITETLILPKQHLHQATRVSQDKIWPVQSLPGLINETTVVFLSCPGFPGLAKRLRKGMSHKGSLGIKAWNLLSRNNCPTIVSPMTWWPCSEGPTFGPVSAAVFL